MNNGCVRILNTDRHSYRPWGPRSVSGSMYWKSILRYPKLTIPQLKSEFSQTHMSMDSSLELPDFHASS